MLTPETITEQRKQHLDTLFQMIQDDPLPDDFLAQDGRDNPVLDNTLPDWADDSQHGA